MLFDLFSNRMHHASALEAIQPTVAEALADPTQLTFQLGTYDPDYPAFSFADIVDAREDVAELEALHRWAMVLHNQYLWDAGGRAADRHRRSAADDDVVVLFKPKSADVDAVPATRSPRARRGPTPVTRVASFAPEVETKQPIRPYPAIDVRKQFKVLPKIEALAVVRGEILCSNDDLIRNTAYCWSPMTADEISYKTGIETRMYSKRGLDEMALDAATAALQRAGRQPEEIGAVDLLLVHEPPVDAVDGDLAVRPAGDVPDPHVGRHHRRVRRPAVRAVRGDPAAAGGQPAGAAGLRGEVLGQDRHRPAVPDDLR